MSIPPISGKIPLPPGSNDPREAWKQIASQLHDLLFSDPYNPKVIGILTAVGPFISQVEEKAKTLAKCLQNIEGEFDEFLTSSDMLSLRAAQHAAEQMQKAQAPTFAVEEFHRATFESLSRLHRMVEEQPQDEVEQFFSAFSLLTRNSHLLPENYRRLFDSKEMQTAWDNFLRGGQEVPLQRMITNLQNSLDVKE